jgi:uncharacterized protein
VKILIADIETMPAMVLTFGRWNQNISDAQVVENERMACFAAKWHGEEKMMFHKAVTRRGQYRLANRAWALLNQADVIVHYNGVKFDVPHIQREFVENGLNVPPAPFKQVDLYKTVKKEFDFASNKLASVAKRLKLTDKMDPGGFALWKACFFGDKDAWATMEEYNRHDVIVTEELYDDILPWIKNHPSHAAYTGEFVCPNCGHADLVKEGFAYTKQSKVQQYSCRYCGTWSRDTRAESRIQIVGVA